MAKITSIVKQLTAVNGQVIDAAKYNTDMTAIFALLSKLITSITDGESGADHIKATAITGLGAGTDVQTILEAVALALSGKADGVITAQSILALQEAIALKENHVDGKGLSTNDFTTVLLNKLNGLDALTNEQIATLQAILENIPTVLSTVNTKVEYGETVITADFSTQLATGGIETQLEEGGSIYNSNIILEDGTVGINGFPISYAGFDIKLNVFSFLNDNTSTLYIAYEYSTNKFVIFNINNGSWYRILSNTTYEQIDSLTDGEYVEIAQFGAFVDDVNYPDIYIEKDQIYISEITIGEGQTFKQFKDANDIRIKAIEDSQIINNLFEKHIDYFGDSITAGQGGTRKYYTGICERNLATATNYGIGGQMLAFAFSPDHIITATSYASGKQKLEFSAWVGLGQASTFDGAGYCVIDLYNSSNVLLASDLTITDVNNTGTKYIKFAVGSAYTLDTNSYFRWRYTSNMVNKFLASVPQTFNSNQTTITDKGYNAPPTNSISIFCAVPAGTTTAMYATLYNGGYEIPQLKNRQIYGVYGWGISISVPADYTSLIINNSTTFKTHSNIHANSYGQTGYTITGDYLLIFGGTNDCIFDRAIGSDGDTTSATFKGALYQIIQFVLANHPTKKTLFVTPYKFHYPWAEGCDDRIINYVDAIISVCAKYGFPVLDLYRNSQMDLSTSNAVATWGGDQLHLGNAGYDWIGKIMENKLRSI